MSNRARGAGQGGRGQRREIWDLAGQANTGRRSSACVSHPLVFAAVPSDPRPAAALAAAAASALLEAWVGSRLGSENLGGNGGAGTVGGKRGLEETWAA